MMPQKSPRWQGTEPRDDLIGSHLRLIPGAPGNNLEPAPHKVHPLRERNTQTMAKWNQYFKSIRWAFRMDKRDVVDCCRHGDLIITVSRAEGWARTPSDERRYVRMTEDEFEAFTRGLIPWAREAENDTPD